ncbi:hypothetical protein OFY17_08520 [Marinomonas sp. C2222]|uniref:CMP/dCMP-type deaminase domain-containing protein n=1 Tax=Marinomonas sargassi TaxID=2984494 RepID=A0ABT2YSR8_9GAMM|nr:hypothetical protein [Marinomonas sargassi]MCV2402922.1 hypothetical protein [Marinomonas sargassi]
MSYEKLYEEAFKVLGDFPLAGSGFSAGSVASALMTEQGNIFTGICIDVACGLGFCAEHSAISEMLKNRETRILEIIAISKDAVMPPCGRCREFIYQINSRNIETKVHLSKGKALLLDDLLPHRWNINA